MDIIGRFKDPEFTKWATMITTMTTKEGTRVFRISIQTFWISTIALSLYWSRQTRQKTLTGREVCAFKNSIKESIKWRWEQQPAPITFQTHL